MFKNMRDMVAGRLACLHVLRDIVNTGECLQLENSLHTQGNGFS